MGEIPSSLCGETVEKILRNSDYSFKKIAKVLNLSRTTLYKRFTEANLSYEFISKVGKIIDFDFSTVFPGLKNKYNTPISQNTLLKIERKHRLLEKRYNKLLAITKTMVQANNFNHFQLELEELEKE
jgi:pyruvate-formate lyase-activating enzyme